MSAGTLLVAGFVVTVLAYLAYLYGAPARRAHWRLIAEERRRLWDAHRRLERYERDRRHPDDMAELADYLRDR
ncbi:MAG TPA: hypothetical protein VH141_05260 [Pseudonocardia sp.]|jgi:predicted metal-dependent hydrolase|nr:hypothetical protein [Pseudonocardia sp.]